MSKFGLNLVEDEERPSDLSKLSDRLATFPAVTTRHSIDLVASDAAAAVHGFTSREPITAAHERPAVQRSRRRIGLAEPTRHLAIRLTESQYSRFVAYADEHQLTYHDALCRLLDQDSPKR